MIHVKLTQNVGNWLTGTELGFIDLTHADAVLGAGTYVQTYPVTPPTQAQLDAATQAAITYNTAHRYILGSEFDTLSGQLTPGTGQIVIGSANGPVKLTRYPTPHAPTIAALGDSITANGIYNLGPGPLNWLALACVASNGVLFWEDSIGGGGYTTESIRTALVPQLLTLDPLPGYVAICAGANDTNTTALASWRTSYTGILDQVQAAGIVPVICAIPPNGNSAKWADAATFNTFLAREAKRRGVPWINWLSDLMDPTTGGNWNAGFSSDGTHPVAAGAQAMGSALWRLLQPYLNGQPTWEPMLATSNTDPHNLMTNGLILLDSNSDGQADNFGVTNPGGGAHATLSIVAPTNGDARGNWQKLTRAVGDGTNLSNLISTSDITVTPGDRLMFACRFQYTPASAPAAGVTGNIGLYQYNSTTTPIGTVSGATAPTYRWLLNGWTAAITPVTLYQEVTVRTGAATARFIAQWSSGEGSLAIAQVTVRNLTALGLA